MRCTLASAVILAGLTIPFPLAAQATPVKACALLPLAELEALFKAKSTPPRGYDMPAMGMCGANFPDVRHVASVNSMPPGPVDDSVTVEQRFTMARHGMPRDARWETKVFESVGCFKSEQHVGDTPLPVVSCFQSAGGYLAVAVASDDPQQASYDVVRDLLMKSMAKRTP